MTFQTRLLGGSLSSRSTRGTSVVELERALANGGEVIEDYPEDKYGPSCLILVFASASRPLHVQCSHPTRPLVKIITVYEPDAEL